MRFCCTVSHGNTEPCWVIRMPFGLGEFLSTPSMRTLPRSGRSKPATTFINVDLPQPEGPTMASVSPSLTEKLTPSTTLSIPESEGKLLTMSVTTILADIAPPDRPVPFQQSHRPIEHETDHSDDDHASDH